MQKLLTKQQERLCLHIRSLIYFSQIFQDFKRYLANACENEELRILTLVARRIVQNKHSGSERQQCATLPDYRRSLEHGSACGKSVAFLFTLSLFCLFHNCFLCS